MSDTPGIEQVEARASQATARTTSSEPRKISTALFNFWFDVLMGVTVVFLAWVSVMMHVVFPPATSAKGWSLWGWTFDQWQNAQFYALCVFLLMTLEHVVLHWTWVGGVIATKVLRMKKRPDDAIQKVYGIGAFFFLMSVAFAVIVAAALTVKSPAP